MARYARILCVILLIFLAAMAPSGSSFDISWYSIDGGGGLSIGGPFDLHGVIGQPDAGPEMFGGTFLLRGGYLAAPSVAACPSDVVVDGVVDVLDLIDLLAGWGTNAPDINGDGITDVLDLIELLAAWGACP